MTRGSPFFCMWVNLGGMTPAATATVPGQGGGPPG